MLFYIIEIFFTVLGSVCAAYGYLRTLQAQRYQRRDYLAKINGRKEHVIRDNVIWGIVCAGLRLYLPLLLSMFLYVDLARVAIATLGTSLLFCGVCALQCALAYRAPVKNPLTPTARLLRVTGVLAALMLVISILLRLMRVPAYLAFCGLPYILALAERLIEPYEDKIAAAFIKEARKKRLKFKRLQVVGISGTFAKTNVKYMLRELLSSKYTVLTPPASYNTAQGLARVIKDQLTEEHQVFIAEMGAKQPGDVKRICKLVRPKYAILTGVNAAGVKAFGSADDAAGTVYELIQSLPEDGFAVFGSDGQYTDRLFAMCPVDKESVALKGDAYLTARKIKFAADGTRFAMVRSDGETVRCHTRLLGCFAVKNILLATAMALRMGIEFEDVPEAVERMLPIEKHLELKDDEEYCVIDDRANEGLDGIYEAVHVLAHMPGQRVLVMLGGWEDLDAAYALGTEIAVCADIVVFVGEQRGQRSMMKGMLKSGFERGGLLTAADEDEVPDALSDLLQPGDTILYEGEPEMEE